MHTPDVTEREISSIACGKCGSKAVVADNQTNQSVPALKCLICGNRQEEGVPCRWPFFKEGAPPVGDEHATEPFVPKRLQVFAEGKALKEKKRRKRNTADILERERMLKNPVRLILSSAKLPKKHQERAVTMTLLSYLDDFEQVLRSERK